MLATKPIDGVASNQFCCSTPMAIQDGLELEHRLLEQVASGQIRSGYAIWRSHQALVVPRSATHKPGFERASQYCAAKGWPVVVRSTGGELTPQTKGFINLSMVVRCNGVKTGIRESYFVICQPLIQWMAAMGIHAYCSYVDGAFCDGDFNLVVNGKKIAGTAQRRKRLKTPGSAQAKDDTAMLLHAVILCDEDLDRIWKVSNDFYKACQLPPFIIGDRHVCLSDLTNQHGESFIQKVMQSLDAVVRRHVAMY